MNPDLTRLDAFLAERDLDGYLLDADAETADQRYLSGFDAPDPYVTLYTPERTALLVSALEYSRATEESRADAVRRWADYGLREKRSEHDPETARAMAFAAFLEEFEVGSVAANRRFPLLSADGLREQGVSIEADSTDVVEEVRAVKTATEIEHVRAAQRANEEAMRAAEELLRAAEPDADDVLYLDGEPLTSERVKREIERTLLRRGCGLDETIVACGEASAAPHDRGSGPLRATETIVVDIFPRDKETKYHADMTRTFVVGEPEPAAREFYDVTARAKSAALDALEPGVPGSEVHAAVCDVFEEAGFQTLRSDETAETGFIHSTGHGVGLDVHERPVLAERGDDELEPGNVVTVEPGLYDPAVGGVRLEDLVVVTDEGYENLTDYPQEFHV